MADSVLWELARDQEVGVRDGGDPRLVALLTDYLVCVASAPRTSSTRPAFADDGVSGTASALALSAAATDSDDIDWSTLSHPGAVVWSALLPVAARAQCDGATVAAAASLGYRAAATMADLLGPSHRAQWHVTATAGGFGAAAAAGAALRLDVERQADAFAHTAAATGGIGQAALERRGAAAFNRAAAAALGIQAVGAAAADAIAVQDPLHGPRGLLSLVAPGLEPTATPRTTVLVDGVDRVSLRLYPVSGFGQAAVHATGLARGRLGGELRELVVEVSEQTAATMDGSTGVAWWSLADAVAATWASGDGFALAPSEASRSVLPRVRIAVADMPVGGARIRATTAEGTVEVACLRPDELPGAGVDGDTRLRKWELMLGSADVVRELQSLASLILRDGVDPARLAALQARQPDTNGRNPWPR